jgi:glutamate dehydrogenase (NADP+)
LPATSGTWKILERLAEPDRRISFGVNWVDDRGEIHVNRGYRAAPSKAANAGGVAVSGLEMAQNTQMSRWSSEEVDQQLREILTRIHRTVRVTAAECDCPGDYVAGANFAGFVKVADAMLDESPI